MKFFVSYTTRDEEVTVNLLSLLALSLQTVGEVYIDIINNDSYDKQLRVFQELDSSNMLVLVKSKNIAKSHWVTKELERAQQVGIPKISINPGEIERLTDGDLRHMISHALRNSGRN